MILRELYRSEARLAALLHGLVERYRSEPEIHHVARDLAVWCERHLEELRVHQEPPAGAPGKLGESALLDDLKTLYLAAAEVSVNWELLAQGAQATKNSDLLVLSQRCHPEVLRILRWANGMLKTLSP